MLLVGRVTSTTCVVSKGYVSVTSNSQMRSCPGPLQILQPRPQGRPLHPGIAVVCDHRSVRGSPQSVTPCKYSPTRLGVDMGTYIRRDVWWILTSKSTKNVTPVTTLCQDRSEINLTNDTRSLTLRSSFSLSHAFCGGAAWYAAPRDRGWGSASCRGCKLHHLRR
jgi:hypothetical protein